MENTASAKVESDENLDYKVMKFEMVMVCALDPTKTGEQTPACTIKQIRVLDKNPGKPDTSIPAENTSQAPVSENIKPESSSIGNDQMCSLPTKKMSALEKEDAMVDCMMRCEAKKNKESRKNGDGTLPEGWRPIRRKRDTV
jgi:hypothetical protein